MPRELLRSVRDGERLASLGVVLGLLAVMCLLIASIGLTLDYRSELYKTRQTIYERCLERTIYDDSSQDAREADVDLYRTLLVIEENLPPASDPRVAEARRREVDALKLAIERHERTLREGVTTACQVYR